MGEFGQKWLIFGQIWLDLGKIKILHPQKDSISYGYGPIIDHSFSKTGHLEIRILIQLGWFV